jgi:hypothetical protein
MRRSQLAPESPATPGTAVAPTRELAGLLTLTNTPDRQLRAEQRASMGGPNTYDDLTTSSSSTYSGRALPDELVYFLSSGIGTPVSTPSAGRNLWVFDQPLTLAEFNAMPKTPLTLFSGEENVENFRAAGCYPEQLVISGEDKGPINVNHRIVGREMVSGAAASPDMNFALVLPANESLTTLRSLIRVSDTSAGLTGTAWPNTGFSFVFTFNTGIVLEYTMDNTTGPSNIQYDIPTATLEVIAKFNAIQAGEYSPYALGSRRFVRITAYDKTSVDATDFRLMLDGCYVITEFVPLDTQRDGTILGRLVYSAVEDTTWGSKIRAGVSSTLATLV